MRACFRRFQQLPAKNAKVDGHDKYIFRACLAALHLNKQDRISLFEGQTLLLLPKAKTLQKSMQLSEYYSFVGVRTHGKRYLEQRFNELLSRLIPHCHCAGAELQPAYELQVDKLR